MSTYQKTFNTIIFVLIIVAVIPISAQDLLILKGESDKVKDPSEELLIFTKKLLRGVADSENFDVKSLGIGDILETSEEETDNSDSNLGIIGDYFRTFNTIDAKPNLLLSGTHFSKDSTQLLKLQVATIPGSSDSSKLANSLRILRPEFSQFYLDLSFNSILNEKKSFAFHTGLSLASSKLTSLDTTGITQNNLGLIHGKIGLEYSLAKFISFFINANAAIPVTDRDNYTGLYGLEDSNVYFNINFGFNSRIQSGNFKGLELGLRIMTTSHTLREIYPKNDAIIPLVTLGFERYF